MKFRSDAFSLIEVVVAVGVFTLGIVVALGLFAPVARSVGQNSDAEAAANVADLLQAELRQRVLRAHSFAAVTNLFSNDQPSTTPRQLFASRDGVKIGAYDAAIWTQGAEKFFEITLTRNAELSPAANDSAGILLAYSARVRWPVLTTSSATAGFDEVQNAAAPHVLFVNGVICR